MIVLISLLFVMSSVQGSPLKSRMPLLGNLRTPLVAELDITDINRQLKEFISTQIAGEVNETVLQNIAEAIKINMMEVKNQFKDQISNLENKLTMVANFTDEIDKMKYNYENEMASFIKRSESRFDKFASFIERFERLESRFDELEQNSTKDTNIMKATTFQDQAYGYREYFVMFTESFKNKLGEAILLIHSRQNSTVFINCMICKKNYTTQINQGENKIKLPAPVFTTDGKSVKGVFLSSSFPLVLYGMNSRSGASDGYLAIPIQFLSQEYITASYNVYDHSIRDYKSTIGVVATEDNTDVSIMLKMLMGDALTYNSKTYQSGETVNVSLSRFETLQISHNYDLSGSIVTSSKPIGVVSGNICSKISESAFCSAFTEMILPTNQLDSNHIIPVVQGRKGSTVRVFCYKDTNIFVKTMTKSIHRSLLKGQFFEFTYNAISFVNSSNDVLVMFYANDKHPKEDSYMMTITGKQHYKSTYDFIVPGNYTSFISVTIQSPNTENFVLDNKKLIIDTKNVYDLVLDGRRYTTFSYGITAGGHILTHELNQTFGLWIYGERTNDGYGFPAGMSYKATHN